MVFHAACYITAKYVADNYATKDHTHSGLGGGITIETQVSGSSWSRVFSDGWVEQGGRVTASRANSGSLPVEFLVTMKDTRYSVLCTSSDEEKGFGNGGKVSGSEIAFGALSTTGMQVGHQGAYDTSQVISWKVCGFKA